MLWRKRLKERGGGREEESWLPVNTDSVFIIKNSIRNRLALVGHTRFADFSLTHILNDTKLHIPYNSETQNNMYSDLTTRDKQHATELNFISFFSKLGKIDFLHFTNERQSERN